jgi:hypothetical protein
MAVRLRHCDRSNVWPALPSQFHIIYVSVNAIRYGWRSRTRDAIAAVRHVFLEADDDGAGVLSRVATRSDLPKLSYVLQSSPNKVHLFWRVEGFSPERVEALQKQLARELGTDRAATPRTQATRLPGFLNHKYQPPHAVTIEYRCPTRRLSVVDFPTSGPCDANDAPLPRRGVPRLPSGLDAVSQARRYLARVPPRSRGSMAIFRPFAFAVASCAGSRSTTSRRWNSWPIGTASVNLHGPSTPYATSCGERGGTGVNQWPDFSSVAFESRCHPDA